MMNQTHLYFLSCLTKPFSKKNLDNRESWDSYLGESRFTFVDRMIKEGLVQHLDIDEQINLIFTVSELKSLLKERGLRVSGNKPELVSRLCAHDPEGMAQIASAKGGGWCVSPKGAELVDQHNREMRLDFDTTIQKIYYFLEKFDYWQAEKIAIEYGNRQVWTFYIGVNWGRNIQIMQEIMESIPDDYVGNEAILEELRIPATILFLFREPSVKDLLLSHPILTDYFDFKLEIENLINISISKCWFDHWRDMERNQLRRYMQPQSSVAFVEVRGSIGPVCSACAQVVGVYLLSDAPVIPVEGCETLSSCKITYHPVFRIETELIEDSYKQGISIDDIAEKRRIEKNIVYFTINTYLPGKRTNGQREFRDDQLEFVDYRDVSNHTTNSPANESSRNDNAWRVVKWLKRLLL
ncbi:hypothetical protein SIID45300_02405 [Candidatus Magnetaquicoccaceae bacterium FCR-1]|uniref:SAP domain-containing protein n=1 Tax=Candidatus Magnetaquiglobus chichijimensis TaxID=3141448 RepID=A0ABQ0CAZ6_9PROT